MIIPSLSAVSNIKVDYENVGNGTMTVPGLNEIAGIVRAHYRPFDKIPALEGVGPGAIPGNE